MLRNTSMPEQVLIPVLGYPDVLEAVDRLEELFGFMERWRVGAHRAQLRVAPGAAVAIVEGTASAAMVDHVMVRVDDVDEHCQRARSQGAAIVAEPSDMPYGERQYTARDHSGRAWVFSETIADVRPEEWGGTSTD